MNRKTAARLTMLVNLLFLVWGFSTMSNLLYTRAQEITAQTSISAIIYEAVWSPDGAVLAVATDTGISIYDSSLQELTVLQGRTSHVLSIAWSIDGLSLASAGGIGDGTIKIWHRDNNNTFTLERTLQTGYEGAMALGWSFDPNNEMLATIVMNFNDDAGVLIGTPQIWSRATWTVVQTLPAYISPTRTLVWSLDGTKLVVGGFSGETQNEEFYIADAISGDIISRFTEADPITTFALSSQGNLAVGVQNVPVIDIDSRTLLFR